MGTPNEQVWPGVSQLPDFKSSFPQWSQSDLSETITDIDPLGLELLQVRIFSWRLFPPINAHRCHAYSTEFPCLRHRKSDVR